MAATTNNYGFPYPEDSDIVDVAGDIQSLAEDIDTKLSEAIADTVGLMVTSNTENGITVTYDDTDNTLDFDVNDFNIVLSGDVSGSATVTNLASINISASVADNSHNHTSSNITDFESSVQSVTDTFLTINVPNGTDPVATTYNDTLSIVQDNGIIVSGSASNTIKISTNASENNDPSTLVKRDSTGKFTVSGIELSTSSSLSASAGVLSWNQGDATAILGLEDGVDLKIGQTNHVRVKNETGSTITKGTVVYILSSGEATPGHPSHPLVGEFIADGSINAADILGITAHDINDDDHGYIISFGVVIGLDTSMYPAGSVLYSSSSSAGYLVDIQPTSPDLTLVIGVVVDSDSVNGSILVNPRVYPTSDLITYDNSDAFLLSSNIKGALDELSIGKVDIGSLSSNITLYATTASANIGGYFLMAYDVEDPFYNDTAVDVATGAITGTDQLIASLVSASGLIIGNPGSINVTTIGNIAKTAGNKNNYAEFFFRAYHRNFAGTETLIGTSNQTGAINPENLNAYSQFFTSAVINFITFEESDRIVIKYYANAIEGTASQYKFQFGGSSPVRTLLPVPVSVIPILDANGIIVSTSTFNGTLSGSDSTVQAALETIDEFDLIPAQAGNSGKYLITNGTNASWDDVDALTLNGESGSFYTDYADTVSASVLFLAESYADASITNLVGGAPGALDTLNELSAALNDDENFATTITNSLATKLETSSASTIYATINSPDLTGVPTAPTAVLGTNSTQIATTAFVKAETAALTGVTSLVGTADEVTVSASAGAVTLSLPTTINANTTGTAAALTTARTIELTGDVTGSVSFDGSASASMVTTVVGGGGSGTIIYQDAVPTAGIETGTLWVDKNGESYLLNGNDFYTKVQVDTNIYTKAQVDELLSGAGFNPFLLMGA